MSNWWTNKPLLFLSISALILPLLDQFLPYEYQIADLMKAIFIFAILGLGLNIVTGYTGILNLGASAFMAIGAYSFAILTCDIYPFQVGFWGGILVTLGIGSITGIILGLPTLRLRGDYLALVTMGFGEIVQNSLRNLESITKGSQGINPLPSPYLFHYVFSSASSWPWYYLFLFFLMLTGLLSYRLEQSPLGRAWVAIREDELAARCMGINVGREKLFAFVISAALCALGGGLWASSLGFSGEPSHYDFQVSVMALCIVIVGGVGSITGVLYGALLMMGLNGIVLVKLSSYLTRSGLVDTTSVFLSPDNWKYMVFGLALLVTMRFCPEGLFSRGSRR